MRSDRLPILTLVGAVALGVTLLVPYAWLVLLTDGLLAAAVVAAAAGWGAWPTAWLGFRHRSTGQQVCIAAALGLGVLSTLTLILGIAGLLSRPVAGTLLATGAVCGLSRVYRAQVHAKSERGGAPSPAQQGVGDLLLGAVLLLVLAVPLFVALFGASLPPGMLWQEEANGYDVLEYHLQGPREYYDAGRISFLPHNVYASFPQQMEMLYLLLMYLAGNVYAAAVPAQLLHAACGILAVVALACWARPGWPRWLVAVVAGSTPWLAHVGCLAYVENGMLFFAAVAAGLVLDHYRAQADGDWRTALAAGLCAGLAGGCKYTALGFIAVGLALAWFATMRASFRLRVGRVVLFGFGALLAFSPWLVRNVAFTGNPVYPFAYDWFGGKAWSADQARQWSAGHHVPAEHDSIAGRLTLASREMFGTIRGQVGAFQPSLFGQGLFVLAFAGAILGWSRGVALLATWTGLILLGWVSLTFIPGRFAIPLIVPLVLLAGEALEPDRKAPGYRLADTRLHAMWSKRLVLLIAFAGALVNDVSLAERLRSHDRWYRSHRNFSLQAAIGQTRSFVDFNWLNETLPTSAYAWLVGDAAVYYIDRKIHYTVTFSRDPWLAFAGGGTGPQECLDWLRSRNVSHVVFSWSEIERLRRTYGFCDLVTREWVARLQGAGLRGLQTADILSGVTSVEIYEVLPRAGN